MSPISQAAFERCHVANPTVEKAQPSGVAFCTLDFPLVDPSAWPAADT